jgi:hypothetical protein
MIKDLKIFRWKSGPQKGQESLYSFKLSGNVTDLFTRLMQAPRCLRHYYRDEWRWEVLPVPFIIDLLRRGTNNFNQEYRRARKKSEEEWT